MTNYFIRIQAKSYSEIRYVIENATYFHVKAPSDIREAAVLLAFVTYRCRNRTVVVVANVST